MNGKIMQVGGAKSLDVIAIEACQEEIHSALNKYNCTLVFQQMYANGMPAENGRFRVMKVPTKAS